MVVQQSCRLLTVCSCLFKVKVGLPASHGFAFESRMNQVNQASWWEPQLYMITPDLQSGDESLIFSSQEEFFQLLLPGESG